MWIYVHICICKNVLYIYIHASYMKCMLKIEGTVFYYFEMSQLCVKPLCASKKIYLYKYI